MDNIELTPQMLAIVPVVTLALQLLKQFELAQKLKRWMPFISIALSYGLCMATGVPDPVLPSIVIGMTASGGYSLARSATSDPSG